jgi:hypothetical protein
MSSPIEGQWRWLWLSPALVIGLALWCSLHGRALGLEPVGLEVALPWAIKSAIGWTAAGVLLGAMGHRIFGSAFAQSRPWAVRTLVVGGVFMVTMSNEVWLLSGGTRVSEWLYDRSPLHLAFAILLMAGYQLLRARQEARLTRSATLESAVARPAAEPAVVEVMTGTGRTHVRIADIECLEADRNYINVHTPERSYLLRQPLRSLEKFLSPRDFLRVHRSTIVNRAKIRERRGAGMLVLNSGRMVRVSRAFARRFQPHRDG